MATVVMTGCCKAVDRRLREEFAKLDLRLNEAKSRIVDLAKGEAFGFLGFDFRRVRSLRGAWRPQYTPQQKKRAGAAGRRSRRCSSAMSPSRSGG